ncbi:MAG: hypothetical protein GY909_15315 [Oligoflexia bacterium]|nr:hypothetical protein [Oligoflexia bacterium]
MTTKTTTTNIDNRGSTAVISDTSSALRFWIMKSETFCFIGGSFKSIGDVKMYYIAVEEIGRWVKSSNTPRKDGTKIPHPKQKKFDAIGGKGTLRDIHTHGKKYQVSGPVYNSAEHKRVIPKWKDDLKNNIMPLYPNASEPEKEDLDQLFFCRHNNYIFVTDDGPLLALGKKVYGDKKCINSYEVLAILEFYEEITSQEIEAISQKFKKINVKDKSEPFVSDEMKNARKWVNNNFKKEEDEAQE